MVSVRGMSLEIEEVRRHCPPSCRRNRDNEPCACATESKIVSKVLIVAKWAGVRRYRAWFTPNPKNGNWPRISNKERFDEQGWFESVRIQIPDNVYNAMAKKAIAVINGRTPQS